MEGGTANNGMMSPSPPPGLISDSMNIVHSAIKVHCAAGGEGGERRGIDRNAAESEDGRERREEVGSERRGGAALFDC